MKTELLDDPALVLPRVLDVHGTLLRLGFKGYSTRRGHFYRQMVPLFGGGVKAQHGHRNISHLCCTIEISEDRGVGNCWIKYGYPTRRMSGKKSKKIIEEFVTLNSDTTFVSIRFQPDHDLREAEKSIRFLFDQMKTKAIDCSVDVDSETGVIKTSIPGYEAVVQAVQGTLAKPDVKMVGEYWVDDDYEPPVPTQPYIRRQSHRMPNFQKKDVVVVKRFRPTLHHNLSRGRC